MLRIVQCKHRSARCIPLLQVVAANTYTVLLKKHAVITVPVVVGAFLAACKYNTARCISPLQEMAIALDGYNITNFPASALGSHGSQWLPVL